MKIILWALPMAIICGGLWAWRFDLVSGIIMGVVMFWMPFAFTEKFLLWLDKKYDNLKRRLKHE